MAWLPEGKKNLKIRLFVSTECMNMADRRTPHDHIGRAYASHRAAKIVIILRCNPWAACYRKVRFRGFVWDRPKSENWATLTPRSTATVRRTIKMTDI